MIATDTDIVSYDTAYEAMRLQLLLAYKTNTMPRLARRYCLLVLAPRRDSAYVKPRHVVRARSCTVLTVR